MNDDNENKVKLKHNFYHHYIRHQRNKVDFSKLEDLRSEIDNLMSKSKKEYYHNINRKLNDPSANSKTLKLVSIIPPILFNGAFVADFQKAANIFNSIFS